MKNLLLLFTFIILVISSIYPQNKKVYLAKINGEIDLGLAPYITRVVNEANENNASAIIFEINTFGGRVDAATQIKDAILSSKSLTIAFINNRAISAGALISLSCNKIVMAPGSSIGATTVVDQTGQKQSEKYQSYMRAEMRSTAEKNGRRADIAEGMVDERVVIPGLVDSTQLVTLTYEEATKYKIADTVASNINEVLKDFNLQKAKIINVQTNWAEEIVKFLHNSIVSSILIMIGFVGIFYEIKTPGFGVPGTIAIISLTLFFGSSYILELASILDIMLFVAGVVLLILEIFVIPGFGIAGISGIILILLSLFFSLTPSGPLFDTHTISLAIIQITGSLLAAIILFTVILKFLPKSRAFNKLVLADAEHSNQGFVSYPSNKDLIGVEGVALTTLRPAGTAEIDGKRVDVMTDSEYVEKGSKIKVLKVEGIKVIVKEIKK